MDGGDLVKTRLTRLFAAVPGIVMLANGVIFLAAPGQAVASLGMPLLSGVARSTQLGDLTAFFLTCGGFIVYGAWRVNAGWLFAGAWMLGLAAAGRGLAWAFNGAALPASLVATESLLTIWLVAAGMLLARGGAPRTPGAEPADG